jgi:excisionase family DNA binding protein
MNELLTVAEAAERLGITKEAVRKRIHRGTLRADKDADGTVRVYLPSYSTASGTSSSPDRNLLYEEMRERIAYLERQLEEEREARRRADTLLARLMDNGPALEAPQEPLGVRETAAEEPVEPTSFETSAGLLGEGSERPRDTAEFPMRGGSLARPWWRRVFGG